MSKETENYGLYLEDSGETEFSDWRKKMNGPDNSNMVKIDTALATKQDKLNGAQGQLVGFDKDGNAVPHPISDIAELQEALSRIPIPMTADELREILKNGEM